MRWWSRRGSLGDLLHDLVPRRRRPNAALLLVLSLVRWRRELVAVGGTAWGLHALAAATHPAAAAALAAVVLVGAVAWPPGRRAVVRRARAVAVEHRLRVGMVQAGVVSWSGRLPALLAATPVDRGVRVVAWCPPGVDVTAFLATRELLAAACWAADVEVARHPRWAHLVHVLVVTASAEEVGR